MTANGVDAWYNGPWLCNNTKCSWCVEILAVEISMDVVHIKVWFGM